MPIDPASEPLDVRIRKDDVRIRTSLRASVIVRRPPIGHISVMPVDINQRTDLLFIRLWLKDMPQSSAAAESVLLWSDAFYVYRFRRVELTQKVKKSCQ